MRARSSSVVTIALALVVVGLGSGCAHIGQDQFEGELASLRRQMEEGDQTTGRRMDALEQRTDGRLAALDRRLDALSSALSSLEGEFDVTVERLETALRFDVPVYFGFDDDTLRPVDLPLLDRFSSVVKEYYPEVLLTVEGFTDPIGPVEYNQKLGLRRAGAVRSYLIESGGFSEGRVRTVSYGEDANRLVAPSQGGATEGWENRRVVLVVEHVGTSIGGELITEGGR